MILDTIWETGAGNTHRISRGWFLFGIIPLYIKRLNIKGSSNYYR